jgi:DnaK suppressor protein
MNAMKSAEFRNLLIAERERIITEWENHGGNTGPGRDWDMKDPEEHATQIPNGTVELRIAEDDLNLLQKVELALRRLQDGTYFQCAECGCDIPLERLMAKPAVSLCIRCQSEKDARKA